MKFRELFIVFFWLCFILAISSCGSKPMRDCKPVIEVPENYNVESLQDIRFTKYSQCEGLWPWE